MTRHRALIHTTTTGLVALLLAVVVVFGFGGNRAAMAAPIHGTSASNAEGVQRCDWVPALPGALRGESCAYDDALTNAFERAGVLSGPDRGFLATEAAAAVPKTNLHHTVPREILKQLPEGVASNPLVRGRAGAPNRWAIPEDLHKAIHQGAGGGAYNQAWKDILGALGREPTVDDVLRLREQVTKQFGIDGYGPGGLG